MPKNICSECYQDFRIVCNFLIKLNDGQAKLSNRLKDEEQLNIAMPDLMSNRSRCLFHTKYPSSAKRPPPAKPPRAAKVKIDQPVGDQNGSLGKRARKLPKRLQESVQGTDLDKIFKARNELKVAENEAPALPAVESNLDEFGAMLNELDKKDELYDFGQEKLIVDTGKHNCDFCERTFKTSAKLARHLTSSHAGSQLACKECEQTFTKRQNLTLHQTTAGHKGFKVVRTFGCSKCNLSFDNEPELKSHWKATHATGTHEHECTDCHRTFAHASSLNYHIDTTHRSTVFECSICGRTFRGKQLLTRHISVVHSNARPYSCDTCDMKFKSSTNLKAHQTSHTGEKRYPCELCEKKFSYKTSLVQHMKWHDGMLIS